MTEKVYHIYAKNRCIYHSLKEDEFDAVWGALNNFVEIFTDYQKEDLAFEKVVKDAKMILDGSY